MFIILLSISKPHRRFVGWLKKLIRNRYRASENMVSSYCRITVSRGAPQDLIEGVLDLYDQHGLDLPLRSYLENTGSRLTKYLRQGAGSGVIAFKPSRRNHRRVSADSVPDEVMVFLENYFISSSDGLLSRSAAGRKVRARIRSKQGVFSVKLGLIVNGREWRVGDHCRYQTRLRRSSVGMVLKIFGCNRAPGFFVLQVRRVDMQDSVQTDGFQVTGPLSDHPVCEYIQFDSVTHLLAEMPHWTNDQLKVMLTVAPVYVHNARPRF